MSLVKKMMTIFVLLLSDFDYLDNMGIIFHMVNPFSPSFSRNEIHFSHIYIVLGY